MRQFPADFDAITEVYQTLLDLRDSAQLLTISTGVRDYSGFVIERIEMKRDADSGDSATFTIAFRQIRIVETRNVKAPKPLPTVVRAMPKVDKGAKGPVPKQAQGTSFARALAKKYLGF